MSRPSNQTQEHTQRLIAIQLLGHPAGRPRESLYRALQGVAREGIDEAIASLAQAGVVIAAEQTVRASDALMRLDQLKLIGV
jgi:hypothetical protein